MTAVAPREAGTPVLSARHLLVVSIALALVPAAIFLLADAGVALFAGQVSSFGSVKVYRVVMNALVLLRFAGLFAASIAVWGLLRSRAAPRWLLVLAVLSGPLAYAVTGFLHTLQYFPPGQAAYYGVNPLFVGGVGSQVAVAAIAEGLWRWRHARKGDPRGSVVTPALVATMVLGFGVLFIAVLWDAGIHWFYVYQQGYKLLFT